MIEAYAFLAAFCLQVLTLSVVLPGWFIRHMRRAAAKFPAERLSQLYPAMDPHAKLARYCRLFRVATLAIALFGAVLLAWMFSRMESPDWSHGASVRASFYGMLQMVPIALAGVLVMLLKRDILRRSSPEAKRKASLVHRRLFDCVSPVAVFLAVIAYVLFVAYVFYLREHPFPGFAGLINIGGISMIYAMNAFAIYKMLYGRKINALETQVDSLQAIGLGVRCLVYGSIACAVFLSVDFTLRAQDLLRWQPFATSVFFAFGALLSMMTFVAPPARSTEPAS